MCDEYTYSHLVEAVVEPKGYNAVSVPIDNFGVTPESLDRVGVKSCCLCQPAWLSLPLYSMAQTLQPTGHRSFDRWLGRSVFSPKRHKAFASYNDLGYSPYTSCKADNCTHNAQCLKAHPFTLPSWHLCLPDVKFNRKENSKWPKAHCPYQGHHIVEEWQQHRHYCSRAKLGVKCNSATALSPQQHRLSLGSDSNWRHVPTQVVPLLQTLLLRHSIEDKLTCSGNSRLCTLHHQNSICTLPMITC